MKLTFRLKLESVRWFHVEDPVVMEETCAKEDIDFVEVACTPVANVVGLEIAVFEVFAVVDKLETEEIFLDDGGSFFINGGDIFLASGDGFLFDGGKTFSFDNEDTFFFDDNFDVVFCATLRIFFGFGCIFFVDEEVAGFDEVVGIFMGSVGVLGSSAGILVSSLGMLVGFQGAESISSLSEAESSLKSSMSGSSKDDMTT